MDFPIKKKYLVDINFKTLYSLADVDEQDIVNHSRKRLLTHEDFMIWYTSNPFISSNNREDTGYISTSIENFFDVDLGIAFSETFYDFIKMEWDEDGKIDEMEKKEEEIINNILERYKKDNE